MQRRSVRLLKLPHGSKLNSMQRRKRRHDSTLPLPNKPNNAPPPKPPHGNRPLSRHSRVPLPDRPRDSSMRKLAGIQGSHPARSDGRKEVQEQGDLIERPRLSQWLAPPRRSPGFHNETWPVWLGEEPADPRRLKSLLASYPSDGMICWSVSARVGNVKNNDPSLVEPIAAG